MGWRKSILILLAIAWLFVVTFNYYIVHKPFAIQNALALLDAGMNVFTALALFLLAAALGRKILRPFEFSAPLERIVFQTGLGLGLISLATLAFGLAGILNAILFWVLLFTASCLLLPDLRALLTDLRSLQFPAPSRFEKFIALFILLALAFAFLYALTPPIAWDAQTYHLVIPKLALERGYIAPPPDNPYFSFPSLIEMLFLAAMALKGDIAAQLIHFGFFLLTLGVVFALAMRYFNSRVAWLAVAILAAVPSLLLVSTWAYVDAAIVFYAFAAFYLARLALEKSELSGFALAGAFGGLAMGVKYTAVIVPIAMLLFSAVRYRQSAVGYLPLVIRHMSLVALFAAPWYLRNLFFTGNPFYPFFLGGPSWDGFRQNWFGRFGSGLLNEPLRLLYAPWDATIYGVEGALGYEATVGVLMLTLVPLLLFTNPKSQVQHPTSANHSVFRNSHSAIRDLILFSLAFYLFWLLGIASSKLLQQTRLLFPAFPFFAILAALAFEKLGELDLPHFSLQRFTRMLVALVLGLTLMSYVLGFASDSPLPYLAGAQARSDWLARHLGEYYKVTQSVNQLPRDTKILALWEPRSYYIDRAIQPDAILDAFPHLVAQMRDADAIARAWKSGGFTHVLLNRNGLQLLLTSQYDPISYDDARILQTILTTYASPVYGAPLDLVNGAIPGAQEEPYALYALK